MQPGGVNYQRAVEETRAFTALILQTFAARLAEEPAAKQLFPRYARTATRWITRSVDQAQRDRRADFEATAGSRLP
jgi:hypothetical protein